MAHLGALLAAAAARLRQAGIQDPLREARLLLAHATGRPAASLLDRGAEIDPRGFDALLARRAAREPLALITGLAGFWTLELEVSPATLIPRADSEALIEAALAARPDRAATRTILDLGTGTGCLLLAALSEYPAAFGLGVDCNPAAAALAARNAARNGLAGRAGLVCGDWADAVAERFDLVLSNPPYIPAADIAGLMPEVRAHEPPAALDGGTDGLDAYRVILRALPRLLAPGGVAVLELGQGQAAAVTALAQAQGLAPSGLHADLGGVDRALVLRASAEKTIGRPGRGL